MRGKLRLKPTMDVESILDGDDGVAVSTDGLHLVPLGCLGVVGLD